MYFMQRELNGYTFLKINKGWKKPVWANGEIITKEEMEKLKNEQITK